MKFKLLLYVYSLLIFLSGAFAWSQESIISPLISETKNDSSLDLVFIQEFFPNANLKDQINHFHTLWGQSHFNKKNKNFILRSNIGFMFSPQESSESYINAPEFYWGTSIKDGWLYLGRKLTTYSFLEDEWSLGLWNSYLRKDYLASQKQGRLGLHLEKKIKGWKLWGFFSPLSLPHQSPKWKLVEGRFESNSPWFNALKPPEHLLYEGVKTPIVYQVEMPSVTEVVKNHQEAFGIKYDEGSFWGLVSYAYKPMSSYYIQILGNEAKIKTTSNDTYIPGLVRPQILYHKINTYELGWRWSQQGVWTSYSLEYPEGVSEVVLKQSPIYNKQIYGVHYYYKDVFLFNFLHKFKLSYFNVDSFGSSKSYDKQSDKLKDVVMKEFQYFYLDAYKLAFTSSKTFGLNQFLISNSYIYSPRNKGGIYQLDFKYHFKKHWVWNLGLNVIGSDDPKANSFFNEFSAFDQVYGGVKYVF